MRESVGVVLGVREGEIGVVIVVKNGSEWYGVVVRGDVVCVFCVCEVGNVV